jgi:uncharacterized protein YbjT (DUF2867 family)
MSTQALVTGTTAVLGRHLIRLLDESGASVHAGTPSGQSMGTVPVRHIDFLRSDRLIDAFGDIDTLFLHIPWVRGRLNLARNALVAARLAGVKFLVLSSCVGADPNSPYAFMRLQGEIDAMFSQSGIPLTIIRPNTVMQSYVYGYADMLKQGALFLPHGDSAMAFIDAIDVANAVARIIRDPGNHTGAVYDLTGPQALTHATAVDLVGAAVGRMIDYVPIESDAASRAMLASGVDHWFVDQLDSLNAFIATNHAAEVTPTFEQLMGHRANWFASFVTEHARAWV